MLPSRQLKSKGIPLTKCRDKRHDQLKKARELHRENLFLQNRIARWKHKSEFIRSSLSSIGDTHVILKALESITEIMNAEDVLEEHHLFQSHPDLVLRLVNFLSSTNDFELQIQLLKVIGLIAVYFKDLVLVPHVVQIIADFTETCIDSMDHLAQDRVVTTLKEVVCIIQKMIQFASPSKCGEIEVLLDPLFKVIQLDLLDVDDVSTAISTLSMMPLKELVEQRRNSPFIKHSFVNATSVNDFFQDFLIPNKFLHFLMDSIEYDNSKFHKIAVLHLFIRVMESDADQLLYFQGKSKTYWRKHKSHCKKVRRFCRTLDNLSRLTKSVQPLSLSMEVASLAAHSLRILKQMSLPNADTQ